MNCVNLLFLILIISSINSIIINDHINLNGNDWITFNSNNSIRIQANVPGEIHTDLLNAKIIGDPYFRFNDIVDRWVCREQWNYEKKFTLTTNYDKLYLILKGIDTVSELFINDKLIGKTNNMFRGYEFEVEQSLLNVGENKLLIKFESSLNYADKMSTSHPYKIPHDYHKFSNGEQNRNFIRKSQASFSWDWVFFF